MSKSRPCCTLNLDAVLLDGQDVLTLAAVKLDCGIPTAAEVGNRWFQGRLRASLPREHLIDALGSYLVVAGDVTPTKLVTLQQTVKAPPGTTRVSLHLVDRKGLDLGPLSEVNVTAPAAPGSGP